MARPAKNIEKQQPVVRPTTRLEKIALIRRTFAEQCRIETKDGLIEGWDAAEQNLYLADIGLGPTKSNQARSDDGLDFILADMERHRMILFK